MGKNKKEKKIEEELVYFDLNSLSKKEQKIIEVFGYLCQTFDNGKGQKEANLLEILKEHNPVYVDTVGIVIPSITETRIVCSSHIDLISSFQKGFLNEKKYSLLVQKEINSVVGALDNTITNAILVLVIEKLRKKGLAQDVEFVFTEGEETDMHGMNNYMEQKGITPFYINLDVTNDNYKYFGSVEYDKPSWTVCKQIKKNLKVGLTTERVDDDLDVVMKRKGRGFSYCLPTLNTIHSYKNSTPVDKLVPYMEGLSFLLSDLDVSDSEQDFEYLKISKAIKFEDKNEMLAKEAKKKKKEDAKPKYTSGSGYSYSKSSSTTYSNFKRYDSFDDSEVEEFKLSPKEKIVMSESVSFILNSIKEANPLFDIKEKHVSFLYKSYLKESFKMEEFVEVFGFNPLDITTLSLIIFKINKNSFKFGNSTNFFVELDNKLESDFDKFNLLYDKNSLKVLCDSLSRSGLPFNKEQIMNAIYFDKTGNSDNISAKADSLFKYWFTNNTIIKVANDSFIFNFKNNTFDVKTAFEKSINYKELKFEGEFDLYGIKLETAELILDIIKKHVPKNIKTFKNTKDFIEKKVKLSKSFSEGDFIYSLNADIHASGERYSSYIFFNSIYEELSKLGILSKLGGEHFLFKMNHGFFDDIVYEDTDECEDFKFVHDQSLRNFIIQSSLFSKNGAKLPLDNNVYDNLVVSGYVSFVEKLASNKKSFSIKEMNDVLSNVIKLNGLSAKDKVIRNLCLEYFDYLSQNDTSYMFELKEEGTYIVSIEIF